LILPLEISRRPEVNIHFGCGTIIDSRFINVDARPMAHVHLTTKSPMLEPFPAASAHSIYGCHVLEHLSFHSQKQVLRRWLDILKPGGRLMLSVPDFDKLVDRFMVNGRDPLAIQAALMGGQDYPGNFHCAIFTRTHLADLLHECGFVEIGAWHPRDERAWPKDHSWTDSVSLNLTARRPQL
jgi:predicted SAM-dependent methyltransferase